jgi:MGT family glycosyltransferase
MANDLDLLRMILAALEGHDIDIVVTVGRDGDPGALGPQPQNVHIERFVPQGAVLPHCKAAITNGGAGSMLGALTVGVPLLMIPALAPSQPRNAQAVADAGAGRQLNRADVTVERLRTEVSALLDEPGYRRAASMIADEIKAMPSANDIVPLIERLADERQPIRAEHNP